WNLLARTEGDARRAVFEQLDRLSIRPEWVLEDEVLAGNREAIEAWRRDLDSTWIVGLSPSSVQCVGTPPHVVHPHPAPTKPPPAPSLPEPPPSMEPPLPEPPPESPPPETWTPVDAAAPEDIPPTTWR